MTSVILRVETHRDKGLAYSLNEQHLCKWGPITKDEEQARGWTPENYVSEYLGYGADVGVCPPYEDVHSFPKLITLVAL